MKAPPFITQPLSEWLDLIRALAALVVVVGHTHRLEIYTGPYPFSFTFELNAVVVFFVLSGLVIASSVDRAGMNGRRYTAARIARIVPVAWAALAVSLGIAVYSQSLGVMPSPVGTDPGDVSMLRTLRAAVFLDESWASGVAINPPWWSLACEVWFYVLFGLATWLRGPVRIAALTVAAAIAGTSVLLMLPAWLVGVGLAWWPALRRVGRVSGTALVLIALLTLQASIVPFVLLEPLTRPIASLYPGHTQFALGYFVLALAVAGGFAGLRALIGDNGNLPRRLKPLVRWAAGMSFSLYVIHWPLLVLLKTNGITAGENPIANVGIIGLVVAVAAVFAHLIEQRREPLRRWLEQSLGAGPRIKTPAATNAGCKAVI